MKTPLGVILYLGKGERRYQISGFASVWHNWVLNVRVMKHVSWGRIELSPRFAWWDRMNFSKTLTVNSQSKSDDMSQSFSLTCGPVLPWFAFFKSFVLHFGSIKWRNTTRDDTIWRGSENVPCVLFLGDCIG